MSNWTIITQSGCKPCAEAKEILRSRGIVAREFDITKDAAIKDFLKALLPSPTTPQVFVDGFRIGGRDELKRYFDVRGD